MSPMEHNKTLVPISLLVGFVLWKVTVMQHNLHQIVQLASHIMSIYLAIETSFSEVLILVISVIGSQYS